MTGSITTRVSGAAMQSSVCASNCACSCLLYTSNYWFHEVSFITNSIAAVLQLGLGIDYAIIM